MDNRIFNFKDERLSVVTAPQCELTAVIGTEGLSLLVTHSPAQVWQLQATHLAGNNVDFGSVESALRLALGREEAISWSYARSRCIVSNSYATLVPRRLFNANQLSDYFRLLLPEREFVYDYDELAEFDCQLVYAVEPEMLQLCSGYFPHARVSHLATALLKTWRSMVSRNDHEVFLNVRNQTAQIAVFERHNLLFYNTFTFEHANDLLYFALLAYDQFRLDVLEIPLTISGSLVEDSAIYRLLYRYIRPLRFASLPATLRLPDNARSLPAHNWLDLMVSG